MQLRLKVGASLLVLLAMVFVSFAQEGALKSGPQVGGFLPGAFHPYNATGEHAGRPHCLVCEHGLQPTVLVFAREPVAADSPLANLLKGLDAAAEKHKAAGLGGFAVFLTDETENIDSRRALLKKLQDLADADSMKLKHIGLALDRAAGPENYNVNKEAEVTVLLYHKHNVLGNFAFKKDALNDESIKTILAAVEKMVPPAPAKKK
jgi:hypothetical protein